MVNNYSIISVERISQLIGQTWSSGKGWSRICLHGSPSSVMHCMVMCMLPGIESGMHRHKTNHELVTYSFVINNIDFRIFNGETSQVDKHILSSTHPIIALPDTTYRSVGNRGTQPIIYIEHRMGPYIPDDIQWM